MQTLARHEATRYVQPLREGGSLPAVVDTDGGGLFVVKFRGAGQGAKALIAELIVGQLAQVLTLPVPELAVIELSAAFGRSEPDPEIQDILRGSAGANVGLRYLDGAFNFDVAAAGALIAGDFATRLVWLDALVTNPDRSHRNPNLLVWRRTPWLIDHGGALYAQHDWPAVDEARTRTAFPRIREHVLLDRAGDLAAVDAGLAAALGPDVIDHILAPTSWPAFSLIVSSAALSPSCAPPDRPEIAESSFRNSLSSNSTALFSLWSVRSPLMTASPTLLTTLLMFSSPSVTLCRSCGSSPPTSCRAASSRAAPARRGTDGRAPSRR